MRLLYFSRLMRSDELLNNISDSAAETAEDSKVMILFDLIDSISVMLSIKSINIAESDENRFIRFRLS